ncbi:hypothetical protein [Roseateles sp.]|uniref:hypothetical protein n=1 Tax=Roseateles sp. TaxID=1971397 RepID=UPI003BAA342E
MKLLKILALALNSLLLLVLSLAIPIMLIAKLTARDDINVACGPDRACYAYSRGAFGTYWQDLVLRQHYFGVYYFETPLRQFNREVLNQLSYEPQSCRLLAEVQVYGEPAQTVAIKLPEPCSDSEGAHAIKPPAKADPPHPQ